MNEVKVVQIDADIGLSIGNDAPHLMEPWKVINSKGKGPYAVETKLGWVVNGILHKGNPEGSSLNHIFSNCISVVNLNDLLIHQYKTLLS